MLGESRVECHVGGHARPMFVHRRGRTATVLLVAMLALAGCSSGSGSDATPRATVATTTPTTRPVTTTTQATTTTLSPKDEVIAAYLAADKQWYQLRSDPTLPVGEAAEYRTGKSLETVVRLVNESRGRGEIARYPTGFPVATVLHSTVDGTHATLSVCTRNDAVVVGRDGAVINDDVVTRRTRVVLTLIKGSWRVSGEVEDAKRQGDWSCAV